MSIIMSTAVGTVYGLFAFGAMGSSHMTKCLASPSSYFPYDYEQSFSAGNYLLIDGMVDVTNKFDMVIQFGFVSNLIFILWQVYKMGLKKKK